MDDTGTIENQINKIATKFFRTFIFSFKGKTDLIFETFVPCNVFCQFFVSISGTRYQGGKKNADLDQKQDEIRYR